jgi:hypothetical protein
MAYASYVLPVLDLWCARRGSPSLFAKSALIVPCTYILSPLRGVPEKAYGWAGSLRQTRRTRTPDRDLVRRSRHRFGPDAAQRCTRPSYCTCECRAPRHPPYVNSPLRDGTSASAALSASSGAGAAVPAMPALGRCRLGALGHRCSWKSHTRESRGPRGAYVCVIVFCAAACSPFA